MNDEAWLLDVVKRCGVHEARASALARAGAQMLRRLAIKCPPGVFGKGECCRRAVALELAAREAGGANLRREALLTACSSRPAAAGGFPRTNPGVTKVVGRADGSFPARL